MSWSLEDLHPANAISMERKGYVIGCAVALFAFVCIRKKFRPGRPVYLVDFTCYKPPDSLKATRAQVYDYSEKSKVRKVLGNL